MPYAAYRTLSDEAVASIVVDLRSTAPLHNPLPATRVNFPVKLPDSHRTATPDHSG